MPKQRLVLLHGLGSHPGVWEPVLERLEPQVEVEALDLPGHRGTRVLDDCTLPAYADAVAEAIGDGRPHVAGNSLGGGIALELARRGAAATATVFSPVGFANALERRYAVLQLKAVHAAARRVRRHATGLMRRPRSRALLMSSVVGRPWRMTARQALADLDGVLGAEAFHATLEAVEDYRCPGGWDGATATVAWGTRDVLLVPWQARRARRRLPAARHVTLRGCGHVPFADDPELVARVILDTVTRSRAGTPARSPAR